MKTLLPLVLLLAHASLCHAASIYRVQKGDTILKISDHFLNESGLSDRFAFAKKIMAANPQLESPNALHPGDHLTIPVQARAESAEKPAPALSAAAPAQPSEERFAEAETPVPATAMAPGIAAGPHLPEESSIETPASSGPAKVASESSAGEVASEAAPAKEEKSEQSAEHGESKAEGHHGHKHKEEEEGDDDFLEIRPRFEFSNFKVKSEELGKEISVKSHLNPSLNFLYGKALGNELHLIVEAGATYAQLGSFDDPAAQLDPSKKWLRNFGIGFEYEFAKDFRLELTAQFVDHLFILPNGEDQFYLSRAMIPEGEAVLNWNFLRLKGSSLGLSAEVEYNGTVHHNGIAYKGTWDPAGALYWETHLGEKKLNYRVSATYSADAQHADSLEQDATTYGLNLQLLFPI